MAATNDYVEIGRSCTRGVLRAGGTNQDIGYSSARD